MQPATFHPLVHIPSAMTAGAGPCPNQKPGTQFRSPQGWQGPNYLSPRCCLPGCALLELQGQLRLASGYSGRRCRHAKHRLQPLLLTPTATLALTTTSIP